MMHMQETSAPAPDVLVTGYFKEHEGYSVYRSRGSGNWLITYTLQGRGLYRQPGLEVWADPGDIVLLQPAALHDYSVPRGGTWEFLWAHFQPRLAWLSWWQVAEVGRGLYKAHLSTAQDQERARLAFLKTHTDASLSGTIQRPLTTPAGPATQTRASSPDEPLSMLQRELALNGLEEVLLLSVRDKAQQGVPARDPRVQRVLDLIAQDLTKSHTLDELARAVALSPSRLSHLFKEEVGDSVTNIILALRLGQAARLLEFSTHSIAMIADEVGFSSPYYLSRQFRQRFGMSPRQYRVSMYTAPTDGGGEEREIFP